MQRRDFLHGSGAVLAALSAPSRLAAAASDAANGTAPFAAPPALAPIEARPDRIIDISVCTRPFRPQGPRIQAERLAGKTVIHNYGHGGAGWSLSWGSARLAVEMALATRDRHIAVIGCGAIGLTSARVAQRAGLRVRIYCRERPPEVRSSAATGVWSPESRICTDEHATPEFAQRWEAMARSSFRTFQSLLGLPGQPVEWRDGYVLSDVPFDQSPPGRSYGDSEPVYANLESLVRDLGPRSQPLQPSQHPFPVPYARRYTQLVFNLAAYARLLMDDFMRDGGEIEQRDFTSPRQFAALKERTIINATGYGARALLEDSTIVPVRGQTARLIPQPEVDYGINYRGHNLSVVPRRDGILVQAQADGDFGNADVSPDRAASEAAVARLAALFRA
ncbi:MAG TPA: FAD-dependent oxidoreductase [Albitalea sp.]|nr:FAD-dependent oxidoreductase [Albitalea sp.]